MNLTAFYSSRFNSDPFVLLDAARDELQDLAALAGIDWSACANNIQLQPRGAEERYTKYNGKSPQATEKGLKGRVEIYSRLEMTDDGIPYPFVNFVRKGADAGSWSGFRFLLNQFQRHLEQGGTTVPVSASQQEYLRRQAEARRKREENARIQALQTSQVREQHLLGWMAFSNAFAAAHDDLIL